MQRSCSLGCLCFVTPGALSSCIANRRTEDLHRMEHAWFAIQTIDSMRIGHNAPFQVSILVLFYPPLFCLCLSVVCSLLLLAPLILFYFRCLPFSNESFLKQIIFVQCQGTGVNFERNVVLTKQDRSMGRISGFRSLRYSRHTSHMQVEFLLP